VKASQEEAPVFTAYYEFLGWVLDRVEKFPKDQRFIFGQRLANHALDVLELIVQALYRKDRRDLLVAANTRLQTVRILLRLCCDRRLISPAQFAFAAQRLTEVGRMLGGWAKSEEAR
jgi:hypothetical protein